MKATCISEWKIGVTAFAIIYFTSHPALVSSGQNPLPMLQPKVIPVQIQAKVAQEKAKDSAKILHIKANAEYINQLMSEHEDNLKRSQKVDRLTDKVEKMTDEITAYKTAYFALLKKRSEDKNLKFKVDSLKCIIDSFPKQVTIYDTVPFVFKAKLKHELKDTIIKKITIKIP